MLKRHVFRFIRLATFVALLSSCVGTIEESPSIKPSVEGQKAKVAFAGAVKCEPISQDKIDVYFNKGSVNGSSNQENMVYQIFQDGNYDEAVATSIGSQISEDENGLLHMVVDGIQKNTEASFVVRAFDSVSGSSDKNYNTCIAKTLDEDLPDFDGIGDVAKFNGIEGRTSLEISWAPADAAVKIGEIEVAGYDIAGYNIYFGKSPGNMDLFTTVQVTNSSHPTTYKFTGLSPGIKYYFRVNAYDSTGRTERNKIIKSEATNTPGSIDFAGVTEVSTPSGTSGYYTLVAHWEKAKGDFNAYKVYAIPKYESQALKDANQISPAYLSYSGGGTINSNDSAMDGYYIGITTDIDQTQFTIPGLLKNMDYAVTVIACESEANTCDSKTPEKGGNKAVIGVTSPKLATFYGLHRNIIPLDGAAGLTQGTITWDLPLADGVCEGIKIVEANSGTEVPVCPADNGGACITKKPNCLETSVVVSGLQLGIEFSAKGVVYSEGQQGDTQFTNTATITPSYDRPQYSPTISCNVDGPTGIDITWREADNGLFSNYLVIWKETSNQDPFGGDVPGWFGAFESAFKSPAADPTDFGYEYKILPKSALSLAIENLKPDTQYRIMVKAYLNLGADHEFDENNSAQDACKTEDILVKSNMLTRIASVGPISQFNNINETLKLVNNRIEVVEGEGDAYGSTLLEWNSFTLANGDSINEILDLLGASLSADDGYHIFRRESLGLSSSYGPGQRTTEVNNIAEGNGWVQLTKDTGGLRANPATGKVEFTDNYDSIFNSYPDQAKLVWYAIKFKLDGKFLKFATNSGGDMLFDVLIPPVGMALQHRAIHNKKFCDAMGTKVQYEDTAEKTFRDKNYRCIYDGLGSIMDSGTSYYDVKGHVLVDRNTLSCNANNPKSGNLGMTMYSTEIDECYVFPSTGAIPSLGPYDIPNVYSGANNTYYHLGSNNPYKLTMHRISRMPVVDGAFFPHDQYWNPYRNFVSITEDFEAEMNTSNVRYYDGGYKYQYDFELDFGVTSRNRTNAWWSDKDRVQFPIYDTPGTSSSFTNQRFTNFATLANTTRPTGKGFTDGFILNKDLSTYPSPSTDEFLDRNYENNTDPLLGLGKSISAGGRPLSATGRLIHNGYSDLIVYYIQNYPSSTNRTCEGVTYTEQDVIDSGQTCTSYYGPFPCIRCYDELGPARPLTNVTASTAHYLCQSHDFMVKTPRHTNLLDPTKPSKVIRKRLLSARELTSSLIPSSGEDVDTFSSSSFDDYGGTRISHSIYLAGQALCDSDASSNGKCFTNPDPTLIAAYKDPVQSSYADGASWPFFQEATKDDKFPDSEMYQNSAGGSFFWQLFDTTNARNLGGAALPVNFGAPAYGEAHTDGGKYASNYPLSIYNPHLVLGQPLWCANQEGLACNPDDQLTTGELIGAVASEANKYIQAPIRLPATITEHADDILPMVSYYNPNPYLNQKHLFHDYNAATVTHLDNSKLFNVRWELLDKVPEAGDIGGKCAVKLEFDNTGKLETIDGIGVD